jgi:hypothetical protein
MEGKFEDVDEVNRQYSRFNAQGTQLKVRLLPPPDNEVIPDDDNEVIPNDDDNEVIPNDDDNDFIPDDENVVIPDDDNEIIPDPITHFESCVGALFENALKNIGDSDMVGLVIQNENNEKDKPIGFSFRRNDQLSVEVIWKLFEKVAQSNSKFNAPSDRYSALRRNSARARKG